MAKSMPDILFDKAKWSQDGEGFWLSLKVRAPAIAKEFAAGMKEKLYVATLKEYRKKRSLDANAYLWVLCQKISEVIRNTKEFVYQDAIKNVGQFDFFPLRNDAVETFLHRWNCRGMGWFAEEFEDSKLAGYKKIIAYYGSSVYDTREMSVLIDYIVNEAKELDIETMTPQELALLKSRWGNE
jgi:hypothetical protein